MNENYSFEKNDDKYAEFTATDEVSGCCGLASIQYFEESDSEALLALLDNAILDATKDQKGAILATHTSKSPIIPVLIQQGFREVAQFKNPSTGNVVLVMMLILRKAPAPRTPKGAPSRRPVPARSIAARRIR